MKNLFSRKKAGAEEKSDKAKEVAEKRQSQFKMVFEEKDQMLSWQSKQSTVARQGNAQREIQEQSDEWRSPIFDVCAVSICAL